MRTIPALQLFAAILCLFGTHCPATPVVTSIDPASAAPGATITISGSDFAPVASSNLVRFGAVSVPASSVQPGALSVIVPSGATMGRLGVQVASQGTGWSPVPFVPTFTPSGTLSSRSFAEGSQYVPPGTPAPAYPAYGKRFGLVLDSQSGSSAGALIADFDGDLRPDLAVAGRSPAKVYIFRNIHAGGDLTRASFAAPLVLSSDYLPNDLAVGDLNGDGKLDLVCANSYGTLSVWENTSAANVISFATRATISLPGGSMRPEGVELIDLDRDGRLDIAFNGIIAGQSGVIRNLGAASPITAGAFSTAFVFNLSGISLCAEDFDGDGRIDLLLNSGDKLHLLQNNSVPGVLNSSSFSAPLSFDVPVKVRTIAAADLDGDRKPEILAAGTDGNFSFFSNAALPGTLTAGSFAPRVAIPLPSSSSVSPFVLSVADLNGDGRVEYLVTKSDSVGVLIGLNRPGGDLEGSLNTFVPLSIRSGDSQIDAYGRVAVGDLNGDGRPDLMVDGGTGYVTLAQSFVAPLTKTGMSISPASLRATTPWRRYGVFKTTQFYDDGSVLDISSASAWSVDDPSVAAIGSAGLVAAQKVGETTIRAAFDGQSASASFAVDPIAMGTYPGSPDERFLPRIENGGADGAVYTIAPQSDGKVLIGGRFSTINGIPRRNIARLNDDGSLDTSFDPGSGPDADVTHVVCDSLGRVLIGGKFSTVAGTGRRAIARLFADGRVDPGFSSPFATASGFRANVIALRPDGRILVGGANLVVSGTSGMDHLVQLLETGVRDVAFTPYALSGETNALLLQADGKVLIGGSFSGTSASGLGLFCLSRLNTDGSRDVGFSHGIQTGLVYSLARQSSGKLIVAGDFSTVHGQPRNFIARLENDGSLDATFVPPTASGWSGIKAVAIAPDDKVLATQSTRVARLTAITGDLDSTFNTAIQPDWAAYALHVAPDETIWTAGGNSWGLGPNMGAIRIHGDVSSYAAWRSRYFSRAQIDADPEGTSPEGAQGPDGTPNLLSYAQGLSPSTQSRAPSQLTSSSGPDGSRFLHFTYERIRGARDLEFQVGVSSDLTTWDYTSSELSPVGAPQISADGLTETVTLKTPLRDAPLFLRLRVALTAP